MEPAIARIRELVAARPPGEGDALVDWLAGRLGRGADEGRRGDEAERLDLACREWLTDRQRHELGAWLEGRVATGRSIVP
ncbi:MAG: hypothetical protein AB7V42_03365 [Thermoleophilia bacterium]